VRFGISAAPLPAVLHLPFASECGRACAVIPSVSPFLVYSIKVSETAYSTDPGQIEDGGDPTTLLLPDGSQAGLGVMQLTSSFPPNWNDAYTNILYAIQHFVDPAQTFWATYGLRSDSLIRAIAASYNVGIEDAAAGHQLGDVGTYTTYQNGVSYSDQVLASFHKLQTGALP
jgi:hypothetical protein